ncbi:MAG TPA: sigma-70 family RNA polymerase sigma factor [Phycisphaerae bacterium]|nr:sigma-70 family RNA polymerase sigma factor [Phycisphaerae bacterium]
MNTDPTSSDVAGLLSAVAGGDSVAAESLFPIVYGELHRIASSYMRRERPDHTLQATALVHEAFVRLVGTGTDATRFENLRHFIATAAVAMRRILVNHAKARDAEKRGGGETVLVLDEVTAEFNDRSISLLALDESLVRLAELDARQARLVELRFFGGMSVEDCATTLGVSARTVHYEWAHARAWLRAQLEGA